MTRGKGLLALGALLLAGLAVYDLSRRSESVLPATVTGIEARDDARGPDTWHVTLEGPAGEIALEPMVARPPWRIGERLCVTRIDRPGEATEHVLAPRGTVC